MSIATDAKDLQINSSHRSDGCFDIVAIDVGVGCWKLQKVHIRPIDINPVEKVLMERRREAARICRINSRVLVQVEEDNLGKIETFLFVQANQFAISTQRSITSGESEDEARFLPDRTCDELCRVMA
jgi:hypothetical protein